MDAKVEVKRIVINVGNDVLNLSLDQAKELQDVLNRTFGEKGKTEYIPVKEYVPYSPYQPYYWYNSYPKYNNWGISYDQSSNTVLCSVK